MIMEAYNHTNLYLLISFRGLIWAFRVRMGGLSRPPLAFSRRLARESFVESSVGAFWPDFRRFQNLSVEN